METTHVCRLCQTATPAKCTTSLFGTKAMKERLASRINDLLGVIVDANDGLPQHVCAKCKRRVETHEKSVEDLRQFKTLARESYKSLSSRGPLKRTKESSGVAGVSPDTVKVRPPPKKLIQRQLDFEQSQLSDCKAIKINDKNENQKYDQLSSFRLISVIPASS